jgi:hypothetical protein
MEHLYITTKITMHIISFELFVEQKQNPTKSSSATAIDKKKKNRKKKKRLKLATSHAQQDGYIQKGKNLGGLIGSYYD